ncbi:MAG: hypothetical protein IJP53_06700 [Synergistaceae bacterium]|nr:hypothetical protein [Synergistaceae bacterium]
MKTKFFCTAAIFCCLLVLFATPAVCADRGSDPETLKRGFLTLYMSEWRSLNFNFILFSAINREFDATVEAMLPGTSGFQLATNHDGVIGQILDNALAEFGPEYELFFKNFYDRYFTFLDANSMMFSHEKLKDLYLYEDLAACEPPVLQNKLDNSGAMFARRLYESLPTPYVSVTSLVLGLALLIFMGVLARLIGREGKGVKIAISLLGVALMAFGSYLLFRWLFYSKGIARDFLFEQAKELYTIELPERFWVFLEPYVMSALK